MNLAGAPWITYYARALGASVGRDVDLHTIPPITGMLTLGSGCAIEPEVDLSGYWLDGDTLRIGPVRVAAGARVASRSTLGPGAEVGRDAVVDAGSWVDGRVPAGERWSGAPAARARVAERAWPDHRPKPSHRWVVAFGVASTVFSTLPLVAAVPGLLVIGWWVRDAGSFTSAATDALLAVPLATLAWLLAYALLTAVLVRALGIGLRAGDHPVRSRIGWQVWATERLMDAARTLLFPIYSSLATPSWLRLLGAKVGRGVEASTVLALPKMTTVNDGAFLADDTMVASYELCGGWLRIEPTRIGKRAFLGNSGMAGPGRSVPKNGLVAVLSSTPSSAKKGSRGWVAHRCDCAAHRAGANR